MKNLKSVFDRKIELLRKAGAEEIKEYSLINNYGYTFIKNGSKYDLRHWLNCYGAEVNHWTVHGKNGKTFNTFEEAVAFIKTL